MKMLLFILSLVAAVQLDATEAYGCTDEVKDFYRGDESIYGVYNNLCIRFQVVKRLVYYLAQADCDHVRGSLVMPKTKEFNEYIVGVMGLYGGNENVWIGLDDLEVESKFAWHDGTELDGRGFFGPNEGFNHTLAGSEDCATLRPEPNGKFHWTDERCDTNFVNPAHNEHYFACQYPTA